MGWEPQRPGRSHWYGGSPLISTAALTKQRETLAAIEILLLQQPASLLPSHGHGGDTGAATRMTLKSPTRTLQEEEKLVLRPLGRAEEMHLGGGGCNHLLWLAVAIPDAEGFSSIHFNNLLILVHNPGNAC